MASNNKIPGLTRRQEGGTWIINKQIKGYGRLYESTGTCSREEAERFLIKRLTEIREQVVFGARPVITWREAATRYLVECADQPSAGLTATYLEQLDPFIGHLPLTHIDDEALRGYIAEKRIPVKLKNGKTRITSNRTINIALQRVVRVLQVCHRSWRDDNKRPWLDVVPAITMMDEAKTRRPAYPMSWDEQKIFFAELPAHLERMALFKVNTGCREQEVCKLRWDWEIDVPEIRASVFLIPGDFGGRKEGSGVKNGEDRLVVLNKVAKSVVDGQRGLDPDVVFPYDGRVIHRMNDSAWRKARIRAGKKWKAEHGTNPHPGFVTLRVHDLKHTFGRRLRAAKISFEDRQALLGHKSGSVTTDYSGAELEAMIEAANKIAATDSRTPTLTILRRRVA